MGFALRAKPSPKPGVYPEGPGLAPSSAAGICRHPFTLSHPTLNLLKSQSLEMRFPVGLPPQSGGGGALGKKEGPGRGWDTPKSGLG